MRARPRINPRCIADHYAAAGERIAEVSFPNGLGCLISCRTLADGTAVVEVYRADPGIRTAPADPVREAAPDMLAALRALVAAFGGLVPDYLRAEVDAAERAIAKAEGR